MLTIAYVTSRKDSKIEWFYDSLKAANDFNDLRIVVISSHMDENEFRWTPLTIPEKDVPEGERPDAFVSITCPKPSVWQGKYRLTKQDWFAAANARNTALCMAKDGWIAYVDDLSVLMPGWMKSVREAMRDNAIVCGAYKKVRQMVVENGAVKSFTAYPGGEDNRSKHVRQDVTSCAGNWLYGCSLVGPVEAFLSVNGWPEDLCDGLSFEDVCMGIVLKNAGWELRYDRRMMTYESEEDHHREPAFRREDWHKENGVFVTGGNGNDDKSHAALNIALQSKSFPNSFGEGGIRELRRRILAGEPFPIRSSPDRDWYTGKLLSEL